MAAATRRWATPETVREMVRRKWDYGTLLRTLALGEPMAPFEVPLSGPRASDIGDRFSEVQDFMEALVSGSCAGSRYELRYKTIGGRAVGRIRSRRMPWCLGWRRPGNCWESARSWLLSSR